MNPDDLINEKLRIEIEQLKKSWWKRPEYISAWSPVIIALFSFLALSLSGFFDSKVEKLNTQISELSILHDSLTGNIQILRDSVKTENNKLLLIKDSLSYINYQLKEEREKHILEKMLRFEKELPETKRIPGVGWDLGISGFTEIYNKAFSKDKIRFFLAVKKNQTFIDFLNSYKIRCEVVNQIEGIPVDSIGLDFRILLRKGINFQFLNDGKNYDKKPQTEIFYYFIKDNQFQVSRPEGKNYFDDLYPKVKEVIESL